MVRTWGGAPHQRTGEDRLGVTGHSPSQRQLWQILKPRSTAPSGVASFVLFRVGMGKRLRPAAASPSLLGLLLAP